MATWQDRVRQLLKEKKMTRKTLSEKIGVSPPAVTNWLKDNRGCTLEYRMKIADALEVSINWLDSGSDELDKNHAPVLNPDSTPAEKARFYEALKQRFYADGGDDEGWDITRKIAERMHREDQETHRLSIEGQAINALEVAQKYPGASASAFVMDIQDESMINPTYLHKPFFPKGARVTIDPEHKPEPGNAVLVNVNGETLLRIWMPAGNKHILSVVNPLYQQALNAVYEGVIDDILIGTAIGCTFSSL